MKNKLLSTYKERKIIESFSLELTATQTAQLLDINHNTINKYYTLTRIAVAHNQEYEAKPFHGVIEYNESYFGGK